MREVGPLALGCERVVVAGDVAFLVWRQLVVVAGDAVTWPFAFGSERVIVVSW
jgi:hypothetical protein